MAVRASAKLLHSAPPGIIAGDSCARVLRDLSGRMDESIRSRCLIDQWYITIYLFYANSRTLGAYSVWVAKTRPRVEHQLLPLLDHLARVGRRAAEATMAPGGLRPRHLIALKLLSEQGPSSQQGLVEALRLDPSNVVGLLNELEEPGLITRRRDPADRRRHIVDISVLGQDELALAQARLSCVEDDLLSALSGEERDTLYGLLVRAVGAKSPTCAADEPPSSRSE
jgi:DNA-binding MarR family transcriptional regulator